MGQSIEVAGGAPAPAAGRYIEVNIFGTPTGRTIWARVGETLPIALQGYSWRLVETGSPPA